MLRSFHFIPADKEHFILKAANLKATAFILDLEDAVSSNNKNLARENIQKHLNSFKCKYVRINPVDSVHFESDMKLIYEIKGDLNGLVVPKVNEIGDLNAVFQQVGKELSIIPLFEDFQSLDNISSILSAVDIQYAGLGIEDMFSVIPYQNDNLSSLISAVKQKFVISCYGSNVYPLDIISTETKNMEFFRAECQEGRKEGFIGKLSIHPSQINIINEVFKISDEELTWAKTILAHDSDDKSGYQVHDNGLLTTPPKIIKARKIITNE